MPDCERQADVQNLCNRCDLRQRRGVVTAGKPICVIPGCGNIARANQGQRCIVHALRVLGYHVEPGPLESPCRIVDGVKPGRYGKARLPDGRFVHAHRAVWELFVGPIPPGMWVLHRCDRPGCIWLDHLYLGTHAENTADMVDRGHTVKGRRSPTARFSDTEVAAIRAEVAAGRTQTSIAREHGVALSTINGIIKGHRYRRGWRDERIRTR